MSTIVTVLRQSAEFQPWQVQVLAGQVAKWAPPNTRFVCLSDVDVPGVETIPLKYDWPGWWAKLEVFRPDLDLGNFLLTDIDNAIVGPLDDILKADRVTMQVGGWNALAYYPEEVRAKVWDDFITDPARHMEVWKFDADYVREGCADYGDAGYLSAWLQCNPTPSQREADYWEDLYPGQTPNIIDLVLSVPRKPRPSPLIRRPKVQRYSPQVQLTPDARVVLCGQPWRPWTLPLFKHIYAGNAITIPAHKDPTPVEPSTLQLLRVDLKSTLQQLETYRERKEWPEYGRAFDRLLAIGHRLAGVGIGSTLPPYLPAGPL